MKSGLGAISKIGDGLLKKDEEEKRKKEEMEMRQRMNKKYLKEAVKFFRQNCRSIEIVRDNELFRTFFILLPFCHMLPEDLKDEFHDKVIRDTAKSKLTFLMQNTE